MQQKKNIISIINSAANSCAAHTITTFMKHISMLALLLMTFAMGARAEDYVITYTNGGTTYYLGMNGNKLQAKTTFDITCVWTCLNGNTEDDLGNNSRSLRNRNNNSYYLTTSCTRKGNWPNNYTYTWSDLSVQTTAINIWRSNNSNIYAYYSTGSGWGAWDREASINVSSLSMIDDDTSSSQNYAVTPKNQSQSISTEYNWTGPTIIPTSVTLNFGEKVTFNASATAKRITRVIPEHTTYSFNSQTYYYYNKKIYNSTDAFITQNEENLTVSYNWGLAGTGSSNLSMEGTGNNCIVTYSTAATVDASATLTVTASASGATNQQATATITIHKKLDDPIGITTKDLTLEVGEQKAISYTLQPPTAYDKVEYKIANKSIASVSDGGMVTGIKAGSTQITITAYKIDGVTPACSTTCTVTVMQRCETPVVTINPFPDGNTATVVLSTATDGATIYYTTDGSKPTTSSTPYTTTFTINNGQTVKAIAVRDGYLDSDVAAVVYSATKVATPTINITTSGVSFGCDTEGVSYYYTTNGDTPTTSSAQWNGTPITGLAEGVTIKVIAAKSGMIISDMATKTYYPASNVDGTTVTLNDLEDHKWSYYSDPDCPIHSLNPADVKITYYGNGISTVATTNDDNPTSFTADATGVKVGIDADANTFVYYKTLERRDGSTAATPSAATGRCAYTTIPNPFSVRPTYGSGDTRWRGFYKWRVKKVSGGTIHSASTGGATYAQGSTINAEEEIYFAPSSEYGMEVEFEALWARAYVVTSNTTSGLKSSVSYERNFVYLSTNTTLRNAALSYPVTYTTLDPSTGNGTKRTITIREGFTCNANTKFENLTFAQYNNNAQTLTANGYDLIVGRGCSGTVNYLRGISQNISNPSYTIRLESGTYNYFSALRGYQTKGGSNGTDTGSSMGGTPSIKVIFGCDYDRATNTGITDNLAITNGAYYGYSVSEGSNITYSETAFCAIVKSGKIGKGFTIDNSYAAKADGAFYIGIAGQRVRGCRNLLIEGGQIASIAGGIDNSANQNKNSIKIRMKGGHVRGVVYGGGARSAAYGNRSLIFTGGTVTGWIGGGCNGEPMSAGQDEDTYGGITHGASCVYFGGNAICGGEGSDVSINGSIGGIVFGAGKGVEGNTTSGRMANGTTVAIADNCNVQRDVYGGGNFGYAQTSTNIFVGGGTVQGGVFGGSNKNNGPVVSILMKDGTIEGGVYGGSNNSGTISNNVTMQINGGQVGTPSAPAHIHGGGYGKDTKVDGNVTLTLGSNTTDPGVTVYGDVYGGSALGTVNDANSDKTQITLNCGTINGSLYGGGLGNATEEANVNGAVTVTVNGGSVKKTSVEGSGGVYGANNINGEPKSSVTVVINGTAPAPSNEEYALYAVYGGGNQADYDYNGGPIVTVNNCDNSIEYVYGGGNAAAVKTTNVTIWGGNVIGNVFGGGHGYKDGAGADVEGDVKVAIKGGTIKKVFGGSNSKGNISGTIKLDINKDGDCDMRIGEVYGGGNEANGNAGTLTIGCTGALVEGDEGHLAHPDSIGKTLEGIGAVYGGANNANIGNDVTLNINSGMVANVFGGNNTGGNIYGDIKVNVNKSANTCGWYVGNVYGAGNLAAYTGSPVVNIQNGTVSGNVFGGGLGETAIVTGNPQVTIGDAVAEHTAIVGGDVYGGGDAANVVGTPVVNIVNKCNTTIGNVYGGGNAADVNGTDVNIDGGTITGMVFGGGHGDNSAEISANVKGNVRVDITGGSIGKVFGGSNSKGNITGTIALTIEKNDKHCGMYIAEVYGGGNEADGNAGSLTIGCTGALVEGDNGHVAHPEKIGKELEGIGAVYGGANNANIGNDVTLNINSGMVAKVFGGNNTGGTVNGNVTVNVNKSANTCGWYVGKVHGGGYGKETNVAKDVTVNIENGTIYGDVYGGSALGKVNSNTTNTTTVNLTGGLIKGDAYGGGLGDSTTEADVNGNVTVTLNGTAFELTTIKDDNGNTIPTSGRIFGCNNINGSPKGTVLVKVLNTVAKNSDGTTKAKPTKGSGIYELQAVYGGGNLAAYNPTNPKADGQFTSYTHDNKAKPVQVVIDGCNETSIEYVYGGGNAAATPATDVTILGSYEIGNVFGGGNGKDRYKLDGDTKWNENKGADVGVIDADAYAADKSKGKYGTGNAMTSVLGGTVNYIYGGSNTKGNIVGEATAYLDEASGCSLVVNSIYGGGNEAYMDGKANIVLGCIDYLKEIYGGSRNADVGRDINITITSGHFDRVFGGNNLGGAIKGSITVNIEETGCNPITIGEVYGGGNKAAYSVYGYEDGKPKETGEKLYSDPVVNLRSFTSIGRVFGGGLGEEAVMVGSPTVNINEVEGENADNTEWTYLGKTINYDDETSVTLPSHSAGAIGAIGTVFGGGNAAKVIGDTHVNIGTLESVIFETPETDTEANRTHKVEGADIRENVYGGGNQADVTGKTNVIVGRQ